MAYRKALVKPGEYDEQGRNIIIRDCGHRHRTPEAANECQSIDNGGRAYLIVDEHGNTPAGCPSSIGPDGVRYWNICQA